MLFANNCNTTLASSLTNVATTLSVTSATGFPTPTGSQYFYCTLADAATQLVIEIVKVTNVTGTTFTIVRGQDGTTGTAFNAGDVVSLRLVRASLNDFPKLDETNTYTGSQVLAASTSSLVPLNIPVGTVPTSPATGSIWSEAEGLYYQNSTYVTELDIGDNAAGVLTQPTITVTGSGATINVTSIEAVLYSQVGWVGDLKKYVIPAATGLSLTDQSANYLVVSYNSGSPVYSITTNVSTIDNSSVVGAALLWRNGTQVHFQPIDWGRSTASRLNRRLVQTNRYQWASGLSLGESTGRIITCTAGVVWYGVTSYSELITDSSSSNAEFWYHVSGVWTMSTVSTYNNTQYDNGTNLVTLNGPGGKYAVNWVYRYLDGSGLPKLAYIMGSGNYSLAQAVASTVPTPPPILSTMAILVGRIIVLQNATTATQIDSAFTQVFSGTTVTNHNDLANIQGGDATPNYYHLSQTDYTGNGTGTLVRTTRPTMSVTGSGFTFQDATDNTKQANFVLSGLTTATNYTYALPALSGSTLAVLGNTPQLFSGTVQFGNNITTSNGTITFGSTSGTSTLIFGQSTVSQTINIQAGATASGSTKTINIATGGLTGSTTALAIGSTFGTTVTANGTWTHTDALTLNTALTVPNGGTGLTTLTANYIPYGNGTGAFSSSTNLTFNGTTLTTTGISTSNNLTFTGTSNRITGDMSNATIASRVAFQTSTVNGQTTFFIIPNGTSTNAGLSALSDSAATNGSEVQMIVVGGSDSRISSQIRGTGTYLPLTMYTGGSERLRLFTSGGFSIGNTTDPGATNLSVTGKIGIGGSPSYPLDVITSTADVRFFSTTGTNLARLNIGNTGGSFQFAIDNSTGSNFGLGGYSRVLWNDGAYPTIFTTNSVQRMQIGATGGVSIGNTFDPGATNLSVTGQTTLGTGLAFGTGLLTLRADAGASTVPSITIDEYGSTLGSISFRRAGGTIASPTATTTTSIISIIGATTGDGTTYANTVAIQSLLETLATPTSQPTALTFSVTPSGSTSRVEVVRFRSTGAVAFNGATNYGSSGQLLQSNGNAPPTYVSSIALSGTINTGGYTVATLPTGVTGARAYVTNALAPVFGATVAGGGAVTIPVFYNGTNWIVG